MALGKPAALKKGPPAGRVFVHRPRHNPEGNKDAAQTLS